MKNSFGPVVLVVSMAAVLGMSGAANAETPRKDESPRLVRPVNGTKHTPPTIVLPEGWAIPGTPGNGGAVPEPVPVSTGTVSGRAVDTSTRPARGRSVANEKKN